jgi:threonine dehydrogenase-like Zn-dependent dehydrogenase
MKALCWAGVNELSVETVDDPSILNDHDVILRVISTVTCGSDLHLIGGYVPAMRAGDILGHEFLGEVVELGADNSNPQPGFAEALWGGATGGCFGYSQITGGFAGSHAQFVRVPFADIGAFPVPESLTDEEAVFASDAAATGWMGADLGGVQPGSTVAVWGAGGVGQMAARASLLLGAEKVIVIDRIPERLAQVRDNIGAETLDYSSTEVLAELREWSGGRGPDVCIEAVGMEAHSTGPDYLYDQVKQQLRLQTDRPTAVRQAIMAARKGGSVFVLGVFGGLVDKFPLGAVINKGLTVRGAQQHGQRYIPMLLERMQRDELTTEHLATHVMPLSDGAKGYDMFKNKKDGCVRAVFQP